MISPRPLVLAILIFAAWNARAESPLDEPGFKDATVRSELKRGFDVVYKSAHDHLEPNLTKMANQLRALSSTGTSSVGYVLGARLAELFTLDFLLRSSEVSAHNTAEEITDAGVLGSSLRLEIRRRAESLSLSEAQVFEAVQRNFEGLLNRYDTGADASIAKTESPTDKTAEHQPRADETPLPEFPPLAPLEFIKLSKDFTLVDSKGRDVKDLPKGKRLRVVSRNEKTVTVDFFGKNFVLPTGVTEPTK